MAEGFTRAVRATRVARIEVVDEPRRLRSNFVKGYEYMPVRIAG